MKDKRVFVAVTESQYELWKQYVNEREISLPEFVRRAVTVYIKMLEKYRNQKK